MYNLLYCIELITLCMPKSLYGCFKAQCRSISDYVAYGISQWSAQLVMIKKSPGTKVHISWKFLPMILWMYAHLKYL